MTTILGISGSLRAASYNTQLLQTANQLLPDDTRLQLFSLANVEFYNEDLDQADKPSGAAALITAIDAADAVLFASPEYNHSMPGVLKNAIDWASRPAFQSPLKDKPCGILTAAMSPVGGARAQADLHNVLTSTLSLPVPSVDYLLPMAQDKFSAEGVLNDEPAKRRLQRYLQALVAWTQRLS